MTDDDAVRDDPFGGFEVVTEPMPDGRSIHYYEWPDDDAGGEARAPESPSDGPTDAEGSGR